MVEKFQFKISSALKNVIGKDLITDDFVAIFELVKNSFDAFSENVKIYFQFESNKKSKIFIIDDGKGMSKDDLINKWLFVAFSAKKEGVEDSVKRIYSGYKGIGRFSCDRLGATLRLKTRGKSDKKIHCLAVNWDDFEKDSKNEFINIDVKYSEEKAFLLPKRLAKKNSGLVLEIGLLREESSWTRDKIIKLKRSLQKLIDPIGDVKNIEVICDRELGGDKKEKLAALKSEREPVIINEIIKNTIFQVLENKTTTLKANINKQGKLSVELVDRGAFIYRTEEDVGMRYPELINSAFYAEIAFLNRSAKNIFSRNMGIPAVQYGSLFLMRNGFRVFPIGDEGNDYWGIDRRKQQGYARFLGSRDLLGFIKISGSEHKFRESSSRNQGLIQSKAAREISECVKQCIMKLEAYVVDVTWHDRLDAENSNFERMELDNNRFRIIELIEKLSKSKKIKVLDFNRNLVSILSAKAKDFEPSLKKLHYIADKFNDKGLIKQISLTEQAFKKAKIAEQKAEQNAEKERLARKKAEKIAEDAAKKATSIFKEKDKVEEAYKEEVKRNIFLTGTGLRDKELLEGFIHQIILYASDSKGRLENNIQDPRQLKKMSEDELLELFTVLLETNEKIISTARFATTANFRMKSSMITEDLNIFLKEYIEKISKAYNTRIRIISKFEDKAFVLKFNPIEMGMVIENFISNSRKIRAPSITFSSVLKANVLHLTVEDNGKGLDKKIIEKKRIFEKGFTRTDGSGIGLYFCKKKIEELGGELSLSEKQPKRGVSFTIKVVK